MRAGVVESWKQMTDGCVWRREREEEVASLVMRRTEGAVVGRGNRIKGNLFSEQDIKNQQHQLVGNRKHKF